jgi:hypothetical protein
MPHAESLQFRNVWQLRAFGAKLNFARVLCFNYDANWMKHGNGADEVEIEELMVKLWLYRAITKYYAVYGIGTPEMAALFPWAGEAGVAVGNASPEEPPHAA